MNLPNREFLLQGWRLANIGNWSLLPWDNNNPDIYSSSSSGIFSLVEWSINRYDYSLRINGSTIDTSSSANWRPDSLFDRINGNGTLLVGDLFVLPRSLFSVEREKFEGYFAHKWGLSELLPMFHNYKNAPPPQWPGINSFRHSK